jgi:hypothetical protein
MSLLRIRLACVALLTALLLTIGNIKRGGQQKTRYGIRSGPSPRRPSQSFSFFTAQISDLIFGVCPAP